MRKAASILVSVLVALASFLAGSWYSRRSFEHSIQPERRVLRYVCPMHPQYISDRPGTAPCCGMRLEPVYSDAGPAIEAVASAPPSMPPGAVNVSPERQQLIGLRVTAVEKKPVRHRMRMPGRVAADETRTYLVNAAVDGWIREAFPHSTGSLVNHGEPLATFHSKDFLAAQQNYFYALNTLDRMKRANIGGPEQLALTNIQVWSNEDNLQSLGMGEAQVQEIARTRQFARNIVLRSPATGFVLVRNVFPGKRFQRGEELFRIADLSRVWILADVFEKEAGYTRAGQAVRVQYQGKTFLARVSGVPPQFDAQSRTLKLRLEMDNPGSELRPGMFVDAEFAINLPPAITAPVDAILDSGLRKTVFVDRGDGMFEPRAVETGWRFGDRVEITRGLEPGERIVVSGNFLLDSESRMKQALASALGSAAKDPVCGMEVDAGTARRKSEYQGKTYYFCSDYCKQEFDGNPERYRERTGEGKRRAAEDSSLRGPRS